jgi:23S rRNA (uracil1939-C5)-methyltransferase
MNLSTRPPAEILTIEKLVHGGSGLARTDSGIVLVDGVLPGEKVLAGLAEKHGGMSYMDLVDIIESSPLRRDPPCRYFGACGGCDWLFIDYERQLTCKKEIFIEAMSRIGKIAKLPLPVLVASPEFGYRRRVQIKIDAAESAGFFRRGSNDVVKIDRCPLCSDRINRILQRCNDDPAAIPDGTCNCKVTDGDGTVASDPVLPGITERFTTIRCGTVAFDVHGNDFVQSNRFLLEPLAMWVASWYDGATLVDLYGGAGFFSMMLAGRCKKGWLIESDRGMAERAKMNFLKNGIDNITSIWASAEKLATFIPACPDMLVVDPPRPGLTSKARTAVASCRPETIVYISCNCATQARDAGFFVRDGGYRIVASALFDLYPNTHHTETVLVFRKE